MKKELRDKWITALRSGDYKQGRERLRGADAFCCLGVLCEVAGHRFNGDSYDVGLDDYGDVLWADAELPRSLQRALGLSRVHDKLIHMNDGFQKDCIEPSSFAEIADWIEANIPAE